jgi:DNA-binding transcriptional LysR family regulator
MKRPYISDRQVEAFRAVAVCGSVTEAARTLHVTQPAISHLLHDFEDALGFEVLTKHGRGIRITEQGQSLFEEIQRAYLGLDAIKSRARAISSGESSSPLRVAVMPAFADTYVSPALGALMHQHGNVRLEIEVLNSNAIAAGLRQRRFDIGVSMPLAGHRDLVWQPLRTSNMVVVMPKDHICATRASITKDCLLNEALIALPPDSPYRSLLDASLAPPHKPLNIAVMVRTQSAGCELLLHGCNALFVVEPAIANRYTQLICRPLSFRLESTIAVSFQTNEKNATLQQFLKELKRTIRRVTTPSSSQRKLTKI